MGRWLIWLLASTPMVAVAGSTADIGETTRQVMEMQRSGEHSVETRPMLKDVSGRVYDRYLESFTHPIPDQFERESGFIDGN